VELDVFARRQSRAAVEVELVPEKNKAAAGSFSLDATLGLLATRRRLGRQGDPSAMRSAFVVSSCML